jgi:hypothetical protein
MMVRCDHIEECSKHSCPYYKGIENTAHRGRCDTIGKIVNLVKYIPICITDWPEDKTIEVKV